MSDSRFLQYLLAIITTCFFSAAASSAIINIQQDSFSVISTIAFDNDASPARVQQYSGLGLFADNAGLEHFESFGDDPNHAESHFNRTSLSRQFDGVYYSAAGESGLGSQVDTAINSRWDISFTVDGFGSSLSLFMGQAALTPGNDNTAWGNFTLLDLTDSDVVASRVNSDFAFVDLLDGHEYSLSVDLNIRGNYDVPAFLAADFLGSDLSLHYVPSPSSLYLVFAGLFGLLLMYRKTALL